MNMITKIKGNKYPDEYFTKFYFKNQLHKEIKLKFLEFGCANGSNLMLPYSYENEVYGIDFDDDEIKKANYNFSLSNESTKYNFWGGDMREFVKLKQNMNFDILLLPSVIYYISKNDFVMFLKDIIKNNLIKKDALLYIRLRSIKDFRYGYGEKVDNQRYKMPESSITGEQNIEIEFYRENDIIEILKEYLNLREFKIFNLDDENEHQGQTIVNSDIVIWGKIN